jgi:hypothetical protein
LSTGKTLLSSIFFIEFFLGRQSREEIDDALDAD